MQVETILHMKEGLGDTSYAQNSSLQVILIKQEQFHLVSVEYENILYAQLNIIMLAHYPCFSQL